MIEDGDLLEKDETPDAYMRVAGERYAVFHNHTGTPRSSPSSAAR